LSLKEVEDSGTGARGFKPVDFFFRVASGGGSRGVNGENSTASSGVGKSAVKASSGDRARGGVWASTGNADKHSKSIADTSCRPTKVIRNLPAGFAIIRTVKVEQKYRCPIFRLLSQVDFNESADCPVPPS